MIHLAKLCYATPRPQAEPCPLNLGTALTLEAKGTALWNAMDRGAVAPEIGVGMLQGLVQLATVYRETTLAHLVAKQYRRDGRLDELTPELRQLVLSQEPA